MSRRPDPFGVHRAVERVPADDGCGIVPGVPIGADITGANGLLARMGKDADAEDSVDPERYADRGGA